LPEIGLSHKSTIYERIIPDTADWPIYLLSQDRSNFIREIDEFTTAKLSKKYKGDLSDLLVKTLYQERIRIKESPWKVDPPNERVFWNKISKQLIKKSLDRQDKTASETNRYLLEKIVNRYSEEIVGTFQLGTHKFAVRFLTILFNRLFNAAVDKSIRSLWRGRRQLYERLQVVGEV
jgi:glycerol-3-phosphate O-acyltransferase